VRAGIAVGGLVRVDCAGGKPGRAGDSGARRPSAACPAAYLARPWHFWGHRIAAAQFPGLSGLADGGWNSYAPTRRSRGRPWSRRRHVRHSTIRS